MDKYIFDESNGLSYERHGDYHIPCLTLPAEQWPVGAAAFTVDQGTSQGGYTSLLSNGRLNSYLADIDQQAQERLDAIIQQMVRSKVLPRK